MVLGGKRCIGAHLHGRVIVAMGAALDQKRTTSERIEKERRAGQGERKTVSLSITRSVEERVLRERERCWRNEDQEEDFLLTCGFLPLCGGALQIRPEPCISPTLFPDFYLPIGCVYQSANRECRRRGFDATTMPFLPFFSLAKPMSIKFSTR